METRVCLVVGSLAKRWLCVLAPLAVFLTPHAASSQGLLGIHLNPLPIGPGAQVASAPNDPLFGVQWGPQQVRADRAWGITRGNGALIAIVDSGIDLDHPDL